MKVNRRVRYIDLVGQYKYDSNGVYKQPHFMEIFYDMGARGGLSLEAREFLLHVIPELSQTEPLYRYLILEQYDKMFFAYSSQKYINKFFINRLFSYFVENVNLFSGETIGPYERLNYTEADFDRFLHKELKEFNYKNTMGRWEGNNFVNGTINDYVKPTDIVKRALQDIILVLINKYMDKWLKIYDAMATEYAPLDNYNMIEHEEYNEAENVKTSHNVDETSKTSHNVDTTSKTSHNVDVDNEVLNNDTTNKINGFNSATASPTNETHIESKENQKALAEDNYDETTNTALATDNYDETRNTADAEDNYDNVERSKDKDDNFRDLTRHGNIGVTTSQQMLESEIDLRMNNNFWKIVFNDISNEMFLQKF